MMSFLQSELHSSVSDPTLRTVRFLGEASARYPSVISFAPGAPFPDYLDNLDIHNYIDRFSEHLGLKLGLTPKSVRRKLFEYGSSAGQINDLIAAALAVDLETDVKAEELVVTVGCQEALLLVLRALRANDKDLLAVVVPCYVGLIGAARFLDFGMLPIHEGATGVDLAKLRKACGEARAKGYRVRALYVAPDFANPSGSLMALSTRVALLELAEQEDLLVIEDSTYEFTAPRHLAIPSLKKLDNNKRVIYMGTFSKICLPGARVGFVVANQTIAQAGTKEVFLAAKLADLKTMVTVSTSPICQAIIGGMLLAHEGSLRILASSKALHYQTQMAHLLDSLSAAIEPNRDVRWNKPKGGFFVRMRLPVVVDDALLELSASDYGVIWTPMKHFFLGGRASYELRLAVSSLSLDQIEEGVTRLSKFVKHICQGR